MSNIDDLTNNLNEFQKKGPADVKLSDATRDKYLKLISDYRAALNTERQKLDTLGNLADPGTLGSATQTKTNLTDDISGSGGLKDTLDKYLAYLDAFSATVKKAADRLISSG